MKTEYWAMIVGALIGSVLGVYIVTKTMKRYDSCKELKRENAMLREVILEQQRMYYSK